MLLWCMRMNVTMIDSRHPRKNELKEVNTTMNKCIKRYFIGKVWCIIWFKYPNQLKSYIIYFVDRQNKKILFVPTDNFSWFLTRMAYYLILWGITFFNSMNKLKRYFYHDQERNQRACITREKLSWFFTQNNQKLNIVHYI